MAELQDESFRSYNYREVWKITEWKDGFVWKVESIGHIHKSDSDKFPSDLYELSSVSTKYTKGQFMSLPAVKELKE